MLLVRADSRSICSSDGARCSPSALSVPLYPSRSSITITELVEGDTKGVVPQRQSTRIALTEPAERLSVETKAVQHRALKDALICSSPRFQAKAVRDKVLDAVIVPPGHPDCGCTALRTAASIPATSITSHTNV